jgi:hypothetical protein
MGGHSYMNMLRSALDHDLETRRYDYCDVASTGPLSYRATLFLTHFTAPYLLLLP